MRYQVTAVFIVDEIDGDEAPSKSEIHEAFNQSFGPVHARKAVGGYNSMLTDLAIEMAEETSNGNNHD
jgi:hypothetical protein